MGGFARKSGFQVSLGRVTSSDTQQRGRDWPQERFLELSGRAVPLGGNLLSMQWGLSCSCVFLRPRQVSLIPRQSCHLSFCRDNCPHDHSLAEGRKQRQAWRTAHSLHTLLSSLRFPAYSCYQGLPPAERQTLNEVRKLWAMAIKMSVREAGIPPRFILISPLPFNCKLLCCPQMTTIKPGKQLSFQSP